MWTLRKVYIRRTKSHWIKYLIFAWYRIKNAVSWRWLRQWRRRVVGKSKQWFAKSLNTQQKGSSFNYINSLWPAALEIQRNETKRRYSTKIHQFSSTFFFHAYGTNSAKKKENTRPCIFDTRQFQNELNCWKIKQHWFQLISCSVSFDMKSPQ